MPPPEIDKRLRCRELRRILERFGVTFEGHGRGGSHGKYWKMINGRYVFDTIPCHNDGDEKSAKVVKKVREKFRISYSDFYNV